jgi:hypothetical protein
VQALGHPAIVRAAAGNSSVSFAGVLGTSAAMDGSAIVFHHHWPQAFVAVDNATSKKPSPKEEAQSPFSEDASM